jgi:hypothetical protein
MWCALAWPVDPLGGPVRQSLMRLTTGISLKQHPQKCFEAWL